MIYLNKALPVLLSPLVVASLLILFGIAIKRRWISICAVFMLLTLSLPLVANPLFRWVEDYAVRQNVAAMPVAGSIVVLSGMITDSPSVDGIAHEWMDPDRFFAGLELFKAGKGRHLIFTKGRLPWSLATISEGEILQKTAISFGVPAEAIKLTDDVVNTQEEAVAVRKLLGEQERRVILVTSAFHMPRARALFEREGLEILPFPVDFKVSVEKLTLLDFLPSAGHLAMSERALREMLGRLYYRYVFRG